MCLELRGVPSKKPRHHPIEQHVQSCPPRHYCGQISRSPKKEREEAFRRKSRAVLKPQTPNYGIQVSNGNCARLEDLFPPSQNILECSKPLFFAILGCLSNEFFYCIVPSQTQKMK